LIYTHVELIVSSQLHIERNAELVASRIEISEWMNVSCNELWTHQPHVKYVFKQGLNDERAVALNICLEIKYLHMCWIASRVGDAV